MLYVNLYGKMEFAGSSGVEVVAKLVPPSGVASYYTTFADVWEVANAATSTTENRAKIVLLADIPESPESSYTVAAGKYITLDLNNHTLKGNGSTSVITVRGDFQLEDTSTAKGGKITGGNANYGGGVSVTSGTFTMSGGSITGNTVSDYGSGGGVSLYSGTFNMSGKVDITNNTRQNGEACNVYLYKGKSINIDGSLDVLSRIGVTMQTPGIFTSGLSGKGSTSNFTSDSTSYQVTEDESSEAILEAIA